MITRRREGAKRSRRRRSHAHPILEGGGARGRRNPFASSRLRVNPSFPRCQPLRSVAVVQKVCSRRGAEAQRGCVCRWRDRLSARGGGGRVQAVYDFVVFRARSFTPDLGTRQNMISMGPVPRPTLRRTEGLVRHRSRAARWTPDRVRGDEAEVEPYFIIAAIGRAGVGHAVAGGATFWRLRVKPGRAQNRPSVATSSAVRSMPNISDMRMR